MCTVITIGAYVMLRFGYDETNGTVIGDISVTGQLYYQDKPQGQSFHASNEYALLRLADARIEQFRTDCGSMFDYIYPDKSGWSMRIYG